MRGYFFKGVGEVVIIFHGLNNRIMTSFFSPCPLILLFLNPLYRDKSLALVHLSNLQLTRCAIRDSYGEIVPHVQDISECSIDRGGLAQRCVSFHTYALFAYPLSEYYQEQTPPEYEKTLIAAEFRRYISV